MVDTSPYDVSMRNRIYRTRDGGNSWILSGLLPYFNPCKFLVKTMDGAIYAGGWGIDSELKIQKSANNRVAWDKLPVIYQMKPEWTVDGFFEMRKDILLVSG